MFSGACTQIPWTPRGISHVAPNSLAHPWLTSLGNRLPELQKTACPAGYSGVRTLCKHAIKIGFSKNKRRFCLNLVCSINLKKLASLGDIPDYSASIERFLRAYLLFEQKHWKGMTSVERSISDINLDKKSLYELFWYINNWFPNGQMYVANKWCWHWPQLFTLPALAMTQKLILEQAYKKKQESEKKKVLKKCEII